MSGLTRKKNEENVIMHERSSGYVAQMFGTARGAKFDRSAACPCSMGFEDFCCPARYQVSSCSIRSLESTAKCCKPPRR